MDRLTRKELKTDHFAVAVQHRVEYMAGHRQQLVRYIAIAVAVVVIVLGVVIYRQHTHTVREEALASALKVQNATVGPPQGEGMLSFPTDADRQKAADKAFTEIANKYSGSQEGAVAQYYLATGAADNGNMAEAEKRFKQVVDSGSSGLASMAKLSLAQVYVSEGKTSEGESMLRDLINHPTALVSKEQATFALAHLIENTKPEEARKLLEPYRTSSRAPISRAAITALGSLPKK